uniref:Uncharacterized protein n=1 Tax=Setaria viridis TaxID=4556 RepID=A0A4U6VT31_SETVI|nr:hypothetical protein SEVIR_3G287700v2 [Setaria viridis]
MSRGQVDAAATRDLLEAEAAQERKAATVWEWKGAASAKHQKGVVSAPVQKENGVAAALRKGKGGGGDCRGGARPQPHRHPNVHRLFSIGCSFLEPRNWW